MNKEQKDSVETFGKRLKKFHQSKHPIDGYDLCDHFFNLIHLLNPKVVEQMEHISELHLKNLNFPELRTEDRLEVSTNV